MEKRSQFASPSLPYLREHFSAQAQASDAPGAASILRTVESLRTFMEAAA